MVNDRQKKIEQELEGICSSVEKVFKSYNNERKPASGMINISLINYLTESLKNIGSIRQLESTMQGLYNSLREISFFRMFRLQEACHIFSWCKVVNVKSGYRHKYFKESNLIVLLRGRMIVNKPSDPQFEESGRVRVETVKIPSSKGGLYENISFSLIDGDYISSNVFRFFSCRPV